MSLKFTCFVLLAVSDEAKTWPPFCFHSTCNKANIRFSFCDIQNDQGLGEDSTKNLVSSNNRCLVQVYTDPVLSIRASSRPK